MTLTDKKILKTIGNTIRQQRLDMGMSKYRLSKLSEVQPMHITLIEAGLINPTLETLEALAKALNLKIEMNK